jgi:biopolymer transport protein ExbD
MPQDVRETRPCAGERARIRRLVQARELPSSDDGELNVVPFLDVIVNVMIFVLATIAVTFTAAITTRPPEGGRRPIPDKVRAAPTIFIVADGFAIKTAAGNVAPGCSIAGPGVAVPRQAGSYDYAGLRACLERLKSSSSEWIGAEQAFITAGPAVDYQTVISTTDAVRATEDGRPLFPEVNFRVPR